MWTGEKERERQRVKNREYRKTCKKTYKESVFKSRLKQKYGLTLEQYEEMWTSQNGKCVTCQVDLVRGGQAGPAANVVHCHATGRVRGILCSNCNRALGLVNDRPEVLTAMVAYLVSF